jgi:hypothetical protein
MAQRMHDYRKFFVDLKFRVLDIRTQALPIHDALWTILGNPMLE